MKALLVIDMLEDFINPKGKLYCGKQTKKIVPILKKEIENTRKKGIPIIYICDRHLPNDPEFKMFPPHCIVNSDGAEIIREISPLENDYVIFKRRFSGFFQTDLDLTLRELKISDLILTGVCTNICVLYTAADARMLNYNVIVLKDCVASYDKKAHNFALKEMEKTLGVKII
jgi:nicotinamidase-related amidase